MQEKLRLKKELGLTEAVLCGIGIILGAGIYVIIGQTAGLAGNALWMSCLVATIVAAFTGLSYAELASRYPKAGAEFEYTKNSFGKRIGFIVGWLTIIAGIVSASAVAISFGENLFKLTHVLSFPEIPVIFSAGILILLCSFIIFLGIKQSARIAIVFTLIEAFGLLLIIFIGIPFIGSVDLMELPPTGLTGILTGATLIFFAFIGFEEMVRMSEETKNAETIIPKALILAIAITSVLYVLVAISAVSVVPWQELSTSKAPLSLVAEKVFGAEGGLILLIIVLFSTSNTVLLILLAASRIIYGIGEDKEFPHIIAKIHPKTHTPYIAIILVMICAIVFSFFDLTFLVKTTDFVLFMIFIVVNAAVIAVRIKEPKIKSKFMIPLSIKNIPVTAVLGILSCIALISHLNLEIIGLSLLLTLIGIIFYEISHKMHKQKLLN
ncbi:MAG: amino acid transporter [Candidatus Diapherotrites archaeon CG10_big_fil_rev_8_21_14_0_10_31_34]|nr:MAG: amino acid transporter [Candidatus Diapherotrites archaeon CG10_big_fil_rev_8_21_14_0_10_31_34]